MVRRLFWAIVAGIISITMLSGCSPTVSDADTADHNLSVEAEQFRVNRRIVFYNSVTDKYILTVEGRCSVDDSADLSHTLAVTCKDGPSHFKKDYFGIADNTPWFAEQLDDVDVSVYHYEVVFKPENLVPDVRLEGGQQ